MCSAIVPALRYIYVMTATSDAVRSQTDHEYEQQEHTHDGPITRSSQSTVPCYPGIVLSGRPLLEPEEREKEELKTSSPSLDAASPGAAHHVEKDGSNENNVWRQRTDRDAEHGAFTGPHPAYLVGKILRSQDDHNARKDNQTDKHVDSAMEIAKDGIQEPTMPSKDKKMPSQSAESPSRHLLTTISSGVQSQQSASKKKLEALEDAHQASLEREKGKMDDALERKEDTKGSDLYWRNVMTLINEAAAALEILKGSDGEEVKSMENQTETKDDAKCSLPSINEKNEDAPVLAPDSKHDIPGERDALREKAVGNIGPVRALSSNDAQSEKSVLPLSPYWMNWPRGSSCFVLILSHESFFPMRVTFPPSASLRIVASIFGESVLQSLNAQSNASGSKQEVVTLESTDGRTYPLLLVQYHRKGPEYLGLSRIATFYRSEGLQMGDIIYFSPCKPGKAIACVWKSDSDIAKFLKKSMGYDNGSEQQKYTSKSHFQLMKPVDMSSVKAIPQCSMEKSYESFYVPRSDKVGGVEAHTEGFRSGDRAATTLYGSDEGRRESEVLLSNNCKAAGTDRGEIARFSPEWIFNSYGGGGGNSLAKRKHPMAAVAATELQQDIFSSNVPSIFDMNNAILYFLTVSAQMIATRKKVDYDALSTEDQSLLKQEAMKELCEAFPDIKVRQNIVWRRYQKMLQSRKEYLERERELREAKSPLTALRKISQQMEKSTQHPARKNLTNLFSSFSARNNQNHNNRIQDFMMNMHNNKRQKLDPNTPSKLNLSMRPSLVDKVSSSFGSMKKPTTHMHGREEVERGGGAPSVILATDYEQPGTDRRMGIGRLLVQDPSAAALTHPQDLPAASMERSGHSDLHRTTLSPLQQILKEKREEKSDADHAGPLDVNRPSNSEEPAAVDVEKKGSGLGSDSTTIVDVNAQSSRYGHLVQAVATMFEMQRKDMSTSNAPSPSPEIVETEVEVEHEGDVADKGRNTGMEMNQSSEDPRMTVRPPLPKIKEFNDAFLGLMESLRTGFSEVIKEHGEDSEEFRAAAASIESCRQKMMDSAAKLVQMWSEEQGIGGESS